MKEENKYIIGVDPSTDNLSMGVLSIQSKDGEPLVVKINPKEWKQERGFQERGFIMSREQVIARYKDVLTEEEINTLKNYGR